MIERPRAACSKSHMLRACLLAAMVICLAACSRDGALGPFAESRTPASLTPRFFAPEGWAWGYVGVGDKPVQRYGVGSTRRVPVAHIVIVPGYGETAEVWFETASDLISSGYTVWVLDRAGQGGSGRYVLPRDLGHAPTFEPDIASLRELIRVVIRPPPDMPLILLTHDDGAVVALAAVRSGLKVDGVIAGSPRLADPAPKRLLGAVRKPDAPPSGWTGWSRDAPDDLTRGRTHDVWRGKLRQAWMTANPDLRLAEASAGWNKGFEIASRQLEAAGGQIRTAVLLINPDERFGQLCPRLPECRIETIAGARASLHLEADRWRDRWLDAVQTFVDGRIQSRKTESNSFATARA